MPSLIAEVRLWGTQIGAVIWHSNQEVGEFQYSNNIIQSGIQLCPITMPLRAAPYQFPTLNKDTYKGLPGLLADMLPDKFGNILIDQWLARHNRDKKDFNPVERLCYIGQRGMGALEFYPALNDKRKNHSPIDIEQMVELASDILTARKIDVKLKNKDIDTQALTQILEIGTSAGGARAKAVIAWNEKTNTICSGHISAQKDFSYWLIKFDGVNENSDKELNDPKGFGRIEYAYYLCAMHAGINMSECRLLKEANRAHFITKRFDRDDNAAKQHMMTLCGMAHFDYQFSGGTSYEQAIDVCKQLQLPMEDKLQLFRRMVFNVIMRNQDDHTKNIAFLMNRKGQWRLSPAYDVTYSYNPKGAWTSQHQMTINGKQDNFIPGDLIQVAKTSGLSLAICRKIIQQVQTTRDKWPIFASKAGVTSTRTIAIQQTFREL